MTVVNDLTGNLIAGVISDFLVVNNNVSGDITVLQFDANGLLQIDGTASGLLLLHSNHEGGESAKGTLEIGTLTGRLHVLGDADGDITIDTLQHVGSFPEIQVDGGTGATSVITIGAFQDDPVVEIGRDNAGDIFAGTLCLPSGIPGAGVGGGGKGSRVSLAAYMNNTVELGGAGVAGVLSMAGGSGDINNGGDVTGQVFLVDASSWAAPFTGTATFGEVGGTILVWGNDLDGTLTVDSIAATGAIEVGLVLSERNLGGTIHVTNAGAATGVVADGGEIKVLGDLESGAKIEVDGPIKGSIAVEGTVYNQVLINDKLEGGTLTLEGNVDSTAYIRVNNMISDGATPSLVDLQATFDGHMLLNSGIGASQTVQIAGALGPAAEIDLNAGAVAGTLSFNGGSGNVINGGAVGRRVSLSNGAAYSGNATFASVSSSGEIKADGPVKGSVTVIGVVSGDVLLNDKLEGGTLTVGGNVDSTAYVRINNMISDGATPSLVDLQGILDGNMLLASGVPANQVVQIAGALDQHGEIDLSAGDVAGSLSFNGGSGDVIDGGAVSGSVSLGNGNAYSGNATFTSVSGQILTTGVASIGGTLKVKGDVSVSGTIGIGGVGGSPASADLASGSKIWIVQNLLGSVSVGGSVFGDISIGNDLASTGIVGIKHDLKANARILIGGDCDGDISVGEQTVANSLISMRDFAGTITINDSDGAFSANGDIAIGAAGIPLPDVVFDGSILVEDDGTIASGNLVGDIDITGCHAEDHDYLDICIEGDVLGAVNIIQGSCSHPVCGYQCGGGACPP